MYMYKLKYSNFQNQGMTTQRKGAPLSPFKGRAWCWDYGIHNESM